MGQFHVTEQSRQGDYMLGAAQTISKRLQGLLQQYNDEKEQREWNKGFLATSGIKDYVPQQALEHWDKISSKEQAGYLAGGARRMDDLNLRRRQQQDPSRLTAQPLMDANGQPIAGKFIVPATGRVIETESSKPKDTWSKFGADLRTATGASYPEWQGAGNKRIEGDQFVADMGARSYVDPATGKPVTYGAETKRIPVSTYEEFRARANALPGGNASAASPAAANQQRSASGGYISGKRYQGRLYIGGDPNDPASWQ